MNTVVLEHVNLTVNDAKKTAQRLCKLFDWKVRWEGASLNGQGHSCHVGSDTFYLAVYSPDNGALDSQEISSEHKSGLNHIGFVVDDIDAMERRVIEAGYEPTDHGDYEPGRRFYFDDEDGVEFEIVSYS